MTQTLITNFPLDRSFPLPGHIYHLVVASDVCVVIESWLRPSLPDSMIAIDSYNIVRVNRRPSINKKGGGILVFIKDCYKFDVDHVNTNINRHGEIISMTFYVHETKYKLIAVYRPPHANNTYVYETVTKLVTAEHHNRKLIILGDFNHDLLVDENCEAFCDPFCTDNNVIQLIDQPTRIDPENNTATLLDHIYTNVFNVCESGLVNLHVSDHCPIYMCLKTARNKNEKKAIYIRSYKNYNKQDFLHRLTTLNWDNFTYEYEPDRLWQILIDNIVKCLSFSAPIRKCFVHVHTPSWLNHIILRQMRERDQLYRHARNTKSVDDWRIAQNQKNRVESMQYYSKKNVVHNLLERFKEDPTKFWDGIRVVLPKCAQVW